jgi:hypothetical protein
MTSAVTLAQSASAGVTLGFKNRLINGNFEVWQRNPSGASVFQSVTYAGADRWCSAGFQQARVSRITVPVGSGPISRFACRVGSSPASDNSNFGTRMSLRQKIESGNCFDLAGQSVTLSFWVRFSGASFPSLANTQSSAFGTWRYSILFNTTTTDSASSSDVQGDSSTSAPLTNGSLPTGWTRYTLTAQVPSNCNNVSVNFQFDQLGTTASETSQWYDVTDVQLEVGTTATAFDERPYPIELLLCQRYFARVGAPGQEFYPCMLVGGYIFPSNWYKWITAKLPVTMRAAPAVTFYPNPGSTAFPGRARYFTGNESGAGNNYVVYGTESSIDYVKFAVYNEHNAITCYGAGAWYDANAEL